MKPPDPTAAGTLNCTGVVPELFKFATGAIIKVAPRYQSHPILRYRKCSRRMFISRTRTPEIPKISFLAKYWLDLFLVNPVQRC
jgi:hypothetical protein